VDALHGKVGVALYSVLTVQARIEATLTAGDFPITIHVGAGGMYSTPLFL